MEIHLLANQHYDKCACTSLDLVKEGSKEMLIKQIMVHFLSNPMQLDTYKHFKNLSTLKATAKSWNTSLTKNLSANDIKRNSMKKRDLIHLFMLMVLAHYEYRPAMAM
jgi:hypothetical protein